MNARRLERLLRELLEEAGYEGVAPAGLGAVVTFDEVGLLTRDRGLVLEFDDGSEFQLTIVQSKRAECEGHESLAGEHMGETVFCDGSCRR